MSINNTSPSQLFGGTWEYWGPGRVPVGVDVNDEDFNKAEKTGGTKTHTLTIEEMPAHNLKYKYSTSIGNTEGSLVLGNGVYGTISGDYGNALEEVGGNQPHNNVQPYVTCYMWKRVA